MRLAVTGTHGLIGTRLVAALEARGDEVIRLVRAIPGPKELRWDPAQGVLDPSALAGIDGAIHLAGVPVAGRRWSPEYKRRVLGSRVDGTAFLAERLALLRPAPNVLISASAVGVYGEAGDTVLTEDSDTGDGFLADVCRRWERATDPASAAGVRTVLIRSGIVQSAAGGALKAQLPLFKFGLGARLGTGRQWTSWIAIDDEVGAILHLLDHDDLTGPVNLTAPEPVTNATYARTLGRVLHRPVLLAVPRVAIEVALGGEMARETLLASQRVLPVQLERSGYLFRHPHLEAALRAELQS